MGEVARQADEAAEGQAVDETEPSGVRDAQYALIIGPALGRALDRRVLGQEERMPASNDQDRYRRQGENIAPAVGGAIACAE